jgi:ECF transporter S component (folate family)
MEKGNKRFTFTTQQIAVLGVLMALSLALSRVSIAIGSANRLSFGFIVNAIIGIMYGPWVAGFAAAGTDLLSSFIFGVQGTFFLGFTLSAFIGSFIYGWFFHRENIRWQQVLLAVLINTVFTNIFLNSLWLNILYQTPFVVLLGTRIPQNLIMGPIRFILIYFISQNKQIQNVINRYGTRRK